MNEIRTNQPCLQRGKGFVLGINRLIIKYLNFVLKRNNCFLSIIHVIYCTVLTTEISHEGTKDEYPLCLRAFVAN